MSQFRDIQDQLNRIEDKLDQYAERIVRTEEGLHSIRGYVRLIITIIISSAGALLSWMLKHNLK